MIYIPDLARIIPATIIVILWLFFVIRVKFVRGRYYTYDIALKWGFLSLTLLILGFLSLVPKPTPLFFRSLAVLTSLGLMVHFCSLQVFLQVKIVSEKKVSVIVSALCLLTIFFDIMRGQNVGSFIDNDVFEMNLPYFLYYVCFFVNLGFNSLLLVNIHIRAMYQQYNDFIDLRIFSVLFGHVCGLVAVFIIITDLTFEMFNISAHSISVVLFHVFVVANALFVCIGFSSDRIFDPVFKPFSKWIRWYKNRKRQRIERLYETMTKIVPIVQLSSPRFKEKRMLVEISHARRIIWSHRDWPTSLSAREEIDVVVNLFQRGVVYEQGGSYKPSPRIENPQTYFTNLADQLYRHKEFNMTTVSIPRIDGIPVLGNLLDFRNRRLELLLRTTRTCGDIGLFFIANRPVVIVNEAQMIQEVLVDHVYSFSKPSNVRQYLRPVLDKSLFLMEGDDHRTRRKLLAPFFQYRHVSSYVDRITRAITRTQNSLFDKTIINVNDEMFRLALVVVGETVFSADLLHGAKQIGDAVTFITHYVSDNLSTLFPIPPTWPSSKNKRYHQSIKILDDALQRSIRDRQSASNESLDMLNILLSTDTLSQEDVRGEALNLLLAGHETTANALAWIWYLLGQHPVIYDRIQSEVDDVVGKRVLQADDLQKTPYVLQVIREALRVYPPTYIIPRKAVSDVGLSSGYVIPPGTRVIVSPYTLHRRSDYFEDPETFDPDRFAPERELKIKKHTYLPFSTGPRACMGMHFAMLEMQIALITTLQHVRLEPLPGQQVMPQPLVTLRPSPFSMRVVRRS